LWHGASWNYVAWGGYWGLLIVGSRTLGALVPERVWSWRGVTSLQVLVMFAFTNLGWLLFRETDFHYLLSDLKLSPWHVPAQEWEAAAYFCSLVLLYSLPLIAHYCLDRRGELEVAAPSAVARSLALRTAASTAMFFAILVLRTANSGDFIYFKF
jgi:alginate O-acetyltransferase complex protein AlgI